MFCTFAGMAFITLNSKLSELILLSLFRKYLMKLGPKQNQYIIYIMLKVENYFLD